MPTGRLAAWVPALVASLGAVSAGAQQIAVQTPATAASATAASAAPPAAASRPAMTNADVLEMVKNHLDEATVVSAIEVNETRFDVSPAALIDLKRAGISDRVIAAMLEAARGKQNGKTAVSGALPGFPGGPPGMPGLDPQMAARMQAAMAQLRAMGYGSAMSMPAGVGGSTPFAGGSAAGPAIHVFLVGGAANRTELAASYAQRAMSKFTTGGPSAGGGLLRSIAGEGLRFAAIGAGPGGMAAMTGFSMLGRFMPGMGPSRPSITYAWGLPGSHSERVLAPTAAFELRYADIPGIDPDAYEPVLLHLVLTKDNYRLLGATRQKFGSGMSMMGAGGGTGDWVAEDRVPAKVQKQGRGFYTLQSSKPLVTGEYALVLRPVKGYQDQSSGFGGGEQVAAAAWDFSTPIAAR
jgi:hypothetical protein